jgi:NADPH:quinone reductase-like Zn-dependent oxidoreductase
MRVTEIVMIGQGRAEEVLKVRRRDRPPPAAGEVAVRVEAVGVSFAERQMLRGRYFAQPKFPFVPGYDVAGTVAVVGPGVQDVAVGQRVAALTHTGGWADQIVLPAKKLAPVPDRVDLADAVAVVTNGVTAWQMVHRVARVRPGQTVLVHGASGGVGTLLVQLARLAGARAIGTASAAQQDAVRALGAVPLDYRSDDVPARVRELAPDGVAAVFDHVGGPRLRDSWRMLGRGGTLVSYGVASALHDSGLRLRPFLPLVARLLLWNALPNGRRAMFYYVMRWPKFFRPDLARVLALLAEGKIDARVARRLPLEQAAEALSLLESGKISGKLVLVPHAAQGDQRSL